MICPLFPLIDEEGPNKPVGCYREQCSHWKKEYNQCGWMTLIEAVSRLAHCVDEIPIMNYKIDPDNPDDFGKFVKTGEYYHVLRIQGEGE